MISLLIFKNQIKKASKKKKYKEIKYFQVILENYD